MKDGMVIGPAVKEGKPNSAIKYKRHTNRLVNATVLKVHDPWTGDINLREDTSGDVVKHVVHGFALGTWRYPSEKA